MKGDYNELKVKFGTNLKRIREERGLSLRTLAARCELDDSQISKIENARWDVQLSTIFELAKGLDVQAKYLIDFEF